MQLLTAAHEELVHKASAREPEDAEIAREVDAELGALLQNSSGS